MKKILLVAAAALSLGSASAFAQDGGDWSAPNTPALTRQEVAQTMAAALQRQQQQRQRVATQPSVGNSYMLFSASPNQNTGFNPSFGGGGNG